MNIFSDISKACNQSLNSFGIHAECYLLPGGIGIKFNAQNQNNLQLLADFPIVEVDLSEIEDFDFSYLNQSRISSIILPPNYSRPFKDLEVFKLQKLAVRNAQASDFESLSNQPIQELKLPGSNINCLRFCSEMPLKNLDLSNTKVTDLNPVKDAKFYSLNLAKTNVSDISCLSTNYFEEINLSATQIFDIEPISMAKNLKKLEIRSTKISDLHPLSETNIEELILPGTMVESISALSYVPIKNLNIIGLHLDYLSSLETMPIEFLAFSPELMSKDNLNFIKTLSIKNLRGPTDLNYLGCNDFVEKYKNLFQPD